MVLSHETVQIDPYFPMEGKKKKGGGISMGRLSSSDEHKFADT